MALEIPSQLDRHGRDDGVRQVGVNAISAATGLLHSSSPDQFCSSVVIRASLWQATTA